jgi:hypothetical protein
MMEDMPMAPMAPQQMERGASGPSAAPVEAIQIRKDFPETWLFNSFNFNKKLALLIIDSS